jgi:LDH2 family malate/lactate/ureidoglycolate dehydrogenase
MVDGNLGLGLYIWTLAQLAIDKAKKHGVGFVGAAKHSLWYRWLLYQHGRRSTLAHGTNACLEYRRNL